jgi:hypothetical protein
MIGYSIQKYYRYDDDNHWEGKIYTSLESLCDALDETLLDYFENIIDDNDDNEDNITFDSYYDLYMHIKDNDIYEDYKFAKPIDSSDLEIQKLQPNDCYVVYYDEDTQYAIVCHEIEV